MKKVSGTSVTNINYNFSFVTEVPENKNLFHNVKPDYARMMVNQPFDNFDSYFRENGNDPWIREY
jgi:hypothetical protein